MLPFALDLTPDAFRTFPGARSNLRHLANLSEIFGNAAEVNHRLAENPLIYEFFDLRDSLPGNCLSFGLTIIQPGTLGGEYFMTRGHFHALEQDGDEVYLGVSGQGLLLLQSRGGEERTLDLDPGQILYTPLAWAHRTVNTGDQPLVFFSIWPAATAYDYEEITRRGFPHRVMSTPTGPALVSNETFHLNH